jgi:hypothetical protein
MKTEKAEATNNYMVRLWSKDHYKKKATKSDRVFHGSITSAISRNTLFFNTAGKFLTRFEQMYLEDEKYRRDTSKR